jgi:hypothetical protein
MFIRWDGVFSSEVVDRMPRRSRRGGGAMLAAWPHENPGAAGTTGRHASRRQGQCGRIDLSMHRAFGRCVPDFPKPESALAGALDR